MKTIISAYIVLITFLNTGYTQYSGNYTGSFTGTSYLSIPNASDLDPVAALTLEAWVNPSIIPATTMTVIGKNYTTSYYLGIQTSGRVVFYPKGGLSFRSRISSVIPTNQWTHIAGVYDGSSAMIYINGILDTSSTAFTGAVGVNTDSLFIGADRVGGSPALFFYGKLDNIRIWDNARNSGVISDNRFIPLEVFAPTGYYDHLKASFQLDNDVTSYSGNSFHSGFYRNFNFTNYSNKAVNFMDYNNNLVLNGSSDYFSVNNNGGFNVTTGITLEAWIKRDTMGTQPSVENIVNKSGGTTRYDYGLLLYPTGEILFAINSESAILISPALITNAQWTHVAASYSSVTGKAVLYINGDSVAGSTFAGNPIIQNNPDNLYIGGIGASLYAANKFKGQLDAVRIWNYQRTSNNIKQNMFNAVSPSSGLTFFNFDKYTNAIYSGGARIYTGNIFAGLAHISSSHLNNNTEMTSPMLSDISSGFYSTDFTSSFKKFFISEANPSGITDSINISSNGAVTNLKVYVLLSHTYAADMTLTLTSPSGTSVNLIANRGSSGNDIMTIFSDSADSTSSSSNTVNGPGISTPFSPGIKPQQSLSTFNGQNKSGWWKLKFLDTGGGDIGYVHGWGINIINLPNKILKLTSLIQGFYNSATNKMVKDTVRVYLRNSNSPYAIIDTAKSVLDSNGFANFTFHLIPTGASFYIVTTHRNSIETWSSAGYAFSSDTLYYNFSLAKCQAYNCNLVQVDSLPSKFAAYSCDVNQDGNVNLTDLISVFNDANNFLTGYNSSDVTGDNTTNLTDLVLTFNNSNSFIIKQTP